MRSFIQTNWRKHWIQIASWIAALILIDRAALMKLPPDRITAQFIHHALLFYGFSLAFAVSFFGLGRCFRTRVLKTDYPLVDLALGFGLFTYFLVFYLKLTINPILPLAIAVAFFGVGAKTIYENRARLWGYLSEPEAPWVVLLLTLITLKLSIVPPMPGSIISGFLYFPGDFDSGMFHVNFPKQVVEVGHYFNPDWLRIPWAPQLTHSWYIFVLSFANDLFLKSSNFVTFIQFAILFLASRFPKGLRLGALFLAVLAASPEFQMNLTAANLDAILALFTVAGFAAFCYFLETKKTRDFALIAVIFGFAGGQKHFGLMFGAPTLVVAGFYYIWFHLNKRSPSVRFQSVLSQTAIPLFTCALIYCITWIPYYAHNWLEGDPLLFPFFGSKINTYGWDSGDLASFTGFSLSHWGYAHDSIGFLRLPFSFMRHQAEYQFFPAGTVFDWITSAAVLSLYTLALLLFFSRRTRKIKYILPVLVLVFQVAQWYRSSQVIRYLFPIMISTAYFLSIAISDSFVRLRKWQTASFLMAALLIAAPWLNRPLALGVPVT